MPIYSIVRFHTVSDQGVFARQSSSTGACHGHSEISKLKISGSFSMVRFFWRSKRNERKVTYVIMMIVNYVVTKLILSWGYYSLL